MLGGLPTSCSMGPWVYRGWCTRRFQSENVKKTVKTRTTRHKNQNQKPHQNQAWKKNKEPHPKNQTKSRNKKTKKATAKTTNKNNTFPIASRHPPRFEGFAFYRWGYRELMEAQLHVSSGVALAEHEEKENGEEELERVTRITFFCCFWFFSFGSGLLLGVSMCFCSTRILIPLFFVCSEFEVIFGKAVFLLGFAWFGRFVVLSGLR